MAQESLSGSEVRAPHFNKINGHLDYKFYSLTKRNIPGFPKIGNRIDIPLDQYSHCCQWIEETNNHSTRIFFFTQNKETAENIKNNLLKGKYTEDVLPLIQNNYEDDKVFINIAVCGDIVRSNNNKKDDWVIDRVKRNDDKKIKGEKDKRGKFENWQIDNVITEKNENNYNDCKGFVYHVTNVLADPPPSLQTLPWDKIKSRIFDGSSSIANDYDYKYHPQINLKVCFVSSTLYNDSLPTITKYPFNVNSISSGENYYKRIKLPFEYISKKNGKEMSRIFYLCSAFSDPRNFSADDPSNKVTQVHYICGFNAKEIKEYLENISQIQICSKEEAVNKIKTEKRIKNIEFDYIIAIPPKRVIPKDTKDLQEDAVELINPTENKVYNIIGKPKEEIPTAEFKNMGLE